jgi:hypothetical protein
MTEHLGYARHDPAGQGSGSGNVRNGTRPKTVLTEATGQVGIDVPRDRAGTFEPQIVKKRQRRLTGVDEIVLSLYAKGLTNNRQEETSASSSVAVVVLPQPKVPFSQTITRSSYERICRRRGRLCMRCRWGRSVRCALVIGQSQGSWPG